MPRGKPLLALFLAFLALAVLAGAAAAARFMSQVGLVEAVPAVPLALVLAFVSVSLGRQARFERERTLRPGGAGLTLAARGLGAIALIVALTAALALAVFAILSLALD
jgi:hypothetical protein